MSIRRMPTARDFPVTRDADGNKLCRMCQSRIPKGRRTLCSDQCSDALGMAVNWNWARAKVKERDQGVCANCGCDTARLLRVLNKAFSGPSYYHNRMGKQFLLRLMRFDTHDVDLWQADHIVEVVRGGTNELTNLQTLCVPCHKAKTKQLAQERAQERRDQKRGLLCQQ